jgi:hypothetical protein
MPVRNAIIGLLAVLCLALPFEANATLQCVAYAREVTGLNLKGDAWKWWEAAEGVYERGNTPKIGSVLVFKRQGSMSHGHVAVVRGATNSRLLLVDHANWAPHRTAGRGKVTQAVPVMDVSPNNDWSQVRVWYHPAREYGGRVYKTQGFVYRPGNAVIPASLRTEVSRPVVAAPAENLDEAPLAVESEAATTHAAKAETTVQPQVVVEAPKAAHAPKVIEAKMAAPIEAQAVKPAASPAGDSDLGKFDARAWAEQA